MKTSRLFLPLLAIMTLSLSSCVGVSLFSDHDEDTVQRQEIAPAARV